MWRELTWFMWRDFVLKWNEVSYGEVLGDKISMYIRVTLHWGYLIVLWLLHLVSILYCDCFNLFCNVWVCVCVSFVMCGCIDNCMGVLVKGVLVRYLLCFVLFVLCICSVSFIYIYSYLLCTSVRTTATEWQLNLS